jgi:hypothetical protein
MLKIGWVVKPKPWITHLCIVQDKLTHSSPNIQSETLMF